MKYIIFNLLFSIIFIFIVGWRTKQFDFKKSPFVFVGIIIIGFSNLLIAKLILVINPRENILRFYYNRYYIQFASFIVNFILFYAFSYFVEGFNKRGFIRTSITSLIIGIVVGSTYKFGIDFPFFKMFE